MSLKLKQRRFSGEDNPMFNKKPHNVGKIAINNGLKNRYINKGESIPQGYLLGLRQNNKK